MFYIVTVTRSTIVFSFGIKPGIKENLIKNELERICSVLINDYCLTEVIVLCKPHSKIMEVMGNSESLVYADWKDFSIKYRRLFAPIQIYNVHSPVKELTKFSNYDICYSSGTKNELVSAFKVVCNNKNKGKKKSQKGQIAMGIFFAMAPIIIISAYALFVK